MPSPLTNLTNAALGDSPVAEKLCDRSEATTSTTESQNEQQYGRCIQDLPLELLLIILDFVLGATVDAQLYDFFDVAHNTYRALRDVCTDWRAIVETSHAATWYNDVVLSKQAVTSPLHLTEKLVWVRDYLALSGDAPLNVYLAFTGVTLYLAHVCNEAHRWHTATIVGSPRGAVDYFNMLQTTPASLTKLELVLTPDVCDFESILELLCYCNNLQTLRLGSQDCESFLARPSMVERSWYLRGVSLPCLTHFHIGHPAEWILETGLDCVLHLPALKTLSLFVPRWLDEEDQEKVSVPIAVIVSLAEHINDLDALKIELERNDTVN
ncbi:hypothetical protein EV714DRAFT_270388 [Schizophyllum commune]